MKLKNRRLCTPLIAVLIFFLLSSYLKKNSHPILSTISPSNLRQSARKNMPEKCSKDFGKVGILVIYTNASTYAEATNVLWCYAISRGYPFFLINPFEDELSIHECSHLQDTAFRKHCVAGAYLANVDWLYVLDGDTTVINAQHCLEDFIDPEAELLFYERFFSGEVAAGNYIAKSTEPARQFLRQWGAIEYEQPQWPFYFSSDNGGLHIQILRVLYPENEDLVQECVGFVYMWEWPNWEPSYEAFLHCVKTAILQWNERNMGNRSAEVRLVIQARAQSFARDMISTNYKWYSGDFMSHEVKTGEPFDEGMNARLTLLRKDITPEECRNPDWAPILNGASFVNETRMLVEHLGAAVYQHTNLKLHAHFANPCFHECWPTCPDVLQTFERQENASSTDLK